MPDPVTGIMAAASAAGAGANIFGANRAANAVTDASNASIDATQHRWNQIIDMFREFYGKGTDALKPYTELGSQAAGQLSSQMGDLTAPITMDQATLEKTPGYEFTKTQGQRAVDQSSVLRGLSGAQLKGTSDFVTGLADKTYIDQFNLANINKTNSFNRLFQTTQGGQNAATSILNTGVQGVGTIAGVGANLNKQTVDSLMAAGNAQAGANIATGQQTGSAIAGAPYLPYVSNRLYPNGIGGGGTPPAAVGMYGSGVESGGNNGGPVFAR